MKYHFYQDAGHGWLKVSRAELESLAIAYRITPYSYQSESGKWVYLEEDCDFATFINAKGWPPRWSDFEDHIIEHRCERSHIRSYRHYNAD